jgi:hypothetical protein
MPKRKRPASLPFTIADLSLASWETIIRRTLLMATGRCTPGEYRRMVREKASALGISAAKLAFSKRTPSAAALIAPWHKRATANARRLRRK